MTRQGGVCATPQGRSSSSGMIVSEGLHESSYQTKFFGVGKPPFNFFFFLAMSLHRAPGAVFEE